MGRLSAFSQLTPPPHALETAEVNLGTVQRTILNSHAYNRLRLLLLLLMEHEQ